MKKLRTNISLGFLFLLCASITACENKQNDSIFSINDFIEKYNLNETLVFGSLPNDGFEISFISIPFIERNEESNKKKDSNSTIKIADYQFINEDDEVIEGELYGSSLITPSSLDYLIELISTRSTGDFHNEWSVSNEWDSDFKKEYLISLDYDDNRSGYANFEVNGFSYMLSSGEYDYLVIGNGSINPNINGDELRMKKVKFEINHKEKCPSQRSIPGLRTYLDEETEYDFSGGAQGSYGPEATYKGHYTFYKNTPTVDPGMIGFFSGETVELSFLNPSSNEMPYKKYNSEKFPFLNLFQVEDIYNPFIKDMTIDYGITFSLLEANNSSINMNDNAKDFTFNTIIEFK